MGLKPVIPGIGGGGGEGVPVDPVPTSEVIVKYDPATSSLKSSEIGDKIGESIAITQDSGGVVINAIDGQVVTFSELGVRSTVIADGVTCTIDFSDPSVYVTMDEVKSLEVYVNPINGGQINLNIDSPMVWETYNVSSIPVIEPYRALFEMFNASSGAGGLVAGIPILHPARRKTEMRWSSLTGVTLSNGVSQNLINLLNGLSAPDYGEFPPFLNTVSGKLNAFNANADVQFKIDISGSFGGFFGNRRLSIDFIGTDNTLVQDRVDLGAVPERKFNFTTFLSVDRNGNIATNGTAVEIEAIGADFDVTDILIVVDQVTNSTDINIV